MSDDRIQVSSIGSSNAPELDAIVVGAGFGGLRALIKLRDDLGMSAKVLDAGGGVGGTWYWNRYPGARCDVQSVNYSYSFSPQLQQEWTWTERYAAQPEIERYANYVADRFKLRPDILLNTRVESATFNAEGSYWTVRTAKEEFSAKYLILATGAYSQPYVPAIDGLGSFRGEVYVTARWPESPVDFQGKRVGVVGTGASGIQTVTAVGKQPVRHLYVFQRTANFAVPAQNHELDPAWMADFKKSYVEYSERARHSRSGTIYDGPVGPVGNLSKEQFEDRMRASLDVGGTSVTGGITDLVAEASVNRRVADYLRGWIHSRVRDTAVGELLCPTDDHIVGARRILVETEYFDRFNQDNVSLVDVRNDPIVAVNAAGLRTRDRQYDLDILILATGFDSGTGAVMNLDIRGWRLTSLSERWANGPTTYLGVMAAGFPNLFMIAGPGSPSVRSQVIVSIEQHVDWIGDLISYSEELGAVSVEATEEAEREWTDHVADLVSHTLLAGEDSQYYGSNVPGKPRVYIAYIGGVGNYRRMCDDVRSADYEGLTFSTADTVICSSRHWSGPSIDTSANTRFGSAII